MTSKLTSTRQKDIVTPCTRVDLHIPLPLVRRHFFVPFSDAEIPGGYARKGCSFELPHDKTNNTSEYSDQFSGTMLLLSDWMITQDEFLNAETGWPSFYGESQETSAAFFDNLDVACIKRIRRRFMSGCGRIGPMDLIAIYESMEKDGMITHICL